MMPVPRADLADPKWQSWCNEARQAMETLIRQYQPGDGVSLQDRLYKEAKPFLLELFHHKCAYCETVISSNQPGDVEHYRPKGRIRDDQGKIVKIIHGNAEFDHPGYWWLAYNWGNLLPSCIDCNRRRRHGGDNIGAGKAEYFAVGGPRAASPGDDLTKEQPLLLDPGDEQYYPKQHFEFREDGTIKPITLEARYTVELLGLNLRETLVAQRAQTYLHAKAALAFLLSNGPTAQPDVLAPWRRQVNDMWEGRSAYSAFARQGLEAVREKVFQATGLRMNLPLLMP